MSLEITGLQVSIGRAHILHGIELSIADGEFFSLLGNSGCGKSTLLKTIAGLVQEQEGEIVLGDLRLHALPAQERRTAIVFQDMRLFPNMTVGENVAYPMKLRKVPKSERVKRVDELLELVHLEGFGKRRVHQLSGGQSQRVAIARALAAEPRMLLLDEPFSALDENLRESMRSFVSEVHSATGLTTIMVTHNQHEALEMSDRIAVMDAGRIMQVGTPQEIYERPANLKIALYLADGDVLDGVVDNGLFACGDVALPCDKPDGRCKAIVRSGAVRIGEGQDFTVSGIRYHGQVNEATLEAGGAIIRYSFPMGASPACGGVVKASIDASQVMFFEDDAS